MARERRTGALGLILYPLLLAVASCQSTPAALEPETSAMSVELTPANLTLAVGDTSNVTARLIDERGQRVPGEFDWTIEPGGIVAVSGSAPDFRVSARATGRTTIRVRGRSQSPRGQEGRGQLTVTVEDANDPPPADDPPDTPADPPADEPPADEPPVDEPPADDPPAQDGRLYGLHMDLTYDGWDWRRAESIDRAVAVGAQVSRGSFMWHKIEPEKGSRDWSRVDAILDELEAAGIEPLMTIVGSPTWANGVDPSVNDAAFYVPTDDAAFDAWLQEYRDFMTEAVERYRGRIGMWEMWNEPNQYFFWKPTPDLDRYVEWYLAIEDVIRTLDPGAAIASAGVTGLCCGPSGTYTGREFIEGLYQRGVYPDHVAIHPYENSNLGPDVTTQWENNFTDIAMIHELMVSYGQGDRSIWVTEWGWDSERVGEAAQADYVRRSLEMIRDQYPYVTVATYFLDYDRPPEYRYGLYREDGSQKPAATAFRDFMKP